MRLIGMIDILMDVIYIGNIDYILDIIVLQPRCIKDKHMESVYSRSMLIILLLKVFTGYPIHLNMIFLFLFHHYEYGRMELSDLYISVSK